LSVPVSGPVSFYPYWFPAIIDVVIIIFAARNTSQLLKQRDQKAVCSVVREA